MTPEEQRIAIAEARGWRLHWQNVGGGELFRVKPKGHSWEFWIPPDSWRKTKEGKNYYNDPNSWNLQPPDYLNDLNAMHEVEKTLDLFQREEFRSYLAQNFYTLDDEGWALAYAKAIHATAAQRAEAYLKTINKWKS